ERPKRADHERVLVQREHRCDRDQREHPPAAEINDPEHDGQADRADQQTRRHRSHQWLFRFGWWMPRSLAPSDAMALAPRALTRAARSEDMDATEDAAARSVIAGGAPPSRAGRVTYRRSDACGWRS